MVARRKKEAAAFATRLKRLQDRFGALNDVVGAPAFAATLAGEAAERGDSLQAAADGLAMWSAYEAPARMRAARNEFGRFRDTPLPKLRRG